MLIWDTLGLLYFFCRNNQHENIEKGTFYYITFFNFLNSDQGVPTDLKRIKVILDWPTPPSIREIWGCHDLTNFYKRFVPYFSILVAPLIELVRNHVPSWEDVHERSFQTLPYSNIPNTTNTYVFILFTGVEGRSPEVEGMMQSYPRRVLDRRLQEAWDRATKEGPRVLMNRRVDF